MRPMFWKLENIVTNNVFHYLKLIWKVVCYDTICLKKVSSAINVVKELANPLMETPLGVLPMLLPMHAHLTIQNARRMNIQHNMAMDICALLQLITENMLITSFASRLKVLNIISYFYDFYKYISSHWDIYDCTFYTFQIILLRGLERRTLSSRPSSIRKRMQW